jgi:hypothetical protein
LALALALRVPGLGLGLEGPGLGLGLGIKVLVNIAAYQINFVFDQFMKNKTIKLKRHQLTHKHIKHFNLPAVWQYITLPFKAIRLM